MSSRNRSKSNSMRCGVLDHRIHHKRSLQISGRNHVQGSRLVLVCVTLALLAITAWSYWPTMLSLFKDWQRNDDYSAGQLVPLVALFLIWRERKRLKECLPKPCWWGGIALLILAQAGRTYGLLFMFESAERYALVLTAAGLVLMVAGGQVFQRVSWILLFLFLMVPFPGRVHNLISAPLRSMATAGSVFLLEAFGTRVSQQGNVMTVNGKTLGVAEACSGLRMLTAFVIVAAFIAYMVKRSRQKKAALLLSSIPVAVICNIIRIFVTAVLMLLVSAEVADKFFHDSAGYVMMPAAVLLMFGELWLMDKLIVPESSPQQGRTHAQAKSATHASAKSS
jgi:exosortase